jgi:cation diffusion facilitator CzcD-associated flavoprotein CzcO
VETDVLIIGAGFSGIGLAIRLEQAGFQRFRIFESEAGVGGTWWLNRYPGCACDVQSHLYSLSFAPRADWSRQFPQRPEIQASLEDLVTRHCLTDRIHLNTRLISARWDEIAQRWRVRDQHGTQHCARVLVSAVGGLSSPAWPSFPGLDEFGGPVIHSQRWPEDLEWRDKRVAVIGTGASAVQFIPHLQRSASQIDVYQRSAPWVLPKPDRPIPRWHQKMHSRLPLYRRIVRLGLFLLLESRLPAFTRFPRLTAFHRRKAQRHLRQQVSDPGLREKLTPDYAMGCKRVLMSNDYYPAVSADNARLITAPIARVTASGIIDGNGLHRPADLIILGTGFKATNPVPEGVIIGRDGIDLAAIWRHGPFAYKGSTVPGFPNFFTLLGPNTALGHNSVLLMIEGQIRYILSALRWMQRTNHPVTEVKNDPTDAWNRDLQRRLDRSVWRLGGCSSWYQHSASGRIPTLWPRFTLTFRWLLRRFDPNAYDCQPTSASQPPDAGRPSTPNQEV